jgi:hypothetical protein
MKDTLLTGNKIIVFKPASGPLVLPKPGHIIELSELQIALYWNLMDKTEGLTPENRNGQYLIDGLPATTYRFAHGYCFMMG